ncbi:MAG: hypothetical protein AB8H47_09560 [Bacteroidia bacterium]
MSRTISLARKIELPSLHNVFELKEKLPKPSRETSYWQAKGLYILDKKARLLCGLTKAREAENTAFTKLHKKLRAYYDGRIYISPLNQAKEGLYFHRDQIEAEGITLGDYFVNPTQKLSLKDLKLVHAVYQEVLKLKEQFGLVHHNVKPKDILIRTLPANSIWQKLGFKEKYSILFLNFQVSDLQIDPEERLHQLFSDLIGNAYLSEFS